MVYIVELLGMVEPAQQYLRVCYYLLNFGIAHYLLIIGTYLLVDWDFL